QIPGHRLRDAVSDAVTPPTAARSGRRLSRVIWAAAAVVGFMVAISVYDRRQQQRAWCEACAEADWLDPGWRWDGVAGRPAPPHERNTLAMPRAATRHLPAPVRAGSEARKLDAEYQRLQPAHRPSAELVAWLRDQLAAAAPALAEARRLVDCPSGQVEL